MRTYAGEEAVMDAEAERGQLGEEELRQVRRDGAEAAWQQFTSGWRSGRDRRAALELEKIEACRKRGYDDGRAGRPLADGRRVAKLSGTPHASGAYASAWRRGRNVRLRW